MSGRLIVVSNRIPTEAEPSGGLVVALHDCLSERGGLWIGAHPETADDGDIPHALEPLDGAKGYDKATFRLSKSDEEDYYLGYANSVLWPLSHRRTDLISIRHQYADAYVRVNQRVAKLVAEVARPGDTIWVQDYHFYPLARFLRQEGFDGPIGFFLHIPFPTLSDLRALPERDEFLDWVVAFDLVGVQTKADVTRVVNVFRGHDTDEFFADGRVTNGDESVAVQAFPIGIDVDAFCETAAEGDGEDLIGRPDSERLLIGADRLDYSKGIPNRFRAFAEWLERREDVHRRATLLQIAPPSRSEVPAYRQVTEELEMLAGTINGRYAELDWTPIRYIHRAIPRETIAKLFRTARAGLVTPLADGMNLVAKEFIAAQDPDDPGVLILSETAGAAEDMQDALLVNAYDVTDIAGAIDTALHMPWEERKARYDKLIEAVRATDISQWSAKFLDALGEAADHKADGPALRLA